MATTTIKWSDDDRKFGPFIYAPDKYGNLAAALGSGDEEYPGCRIRFSAFGHTLIVALPAIIKPWRKKVVASSWDAATVARLGRDWYYDTHEREYGFSCSEGFLRVFLGRQTDDSSTTQSWSYFLPWTQWKFIRHSIYDLDGKFFATEVERVSSLGTQEGRDLWEQWQATLKRCQTCSFSFKDFDGEELTVKTRIEEREWHFGTGWFKWLRFFRKAKIHRSLDLEFSGETGKRKGSWKGGTIGHSIEMLPGELHESAFRRYCTEHEMTFVK